MGRESGQVVLPRWTHNPVILTLSSRSDKDVSSLFKIRKSSALLAWEKQPTFGNATTGFPAKWRLRNESGNSILMTRHQIWASSASDWLNQISHAARPIRSTTQIWVVTRNQYELVWNFCARFSSFGGETSDSVTKCRLFPQATALSVNYQLHVSFDSASWSF